MANPTLYICGECENENCESSGSNRTCVNCGGFISRPRIVTNADRIRKMSVEELADLLTAVDCIDCPLNSEITWCEGKGKTCRDNVLAWLNQEVNV